RLGNTWEHVAERQVLRPADCDRRLDLRRGQNAPIDLALGRDDAGEHERERSKRELGSVVHVLSPICRVAPHLEHHGVVVTPVADTQQWQAACQVYWFWSGVQLVDSRDVCVGTPRGAGGSLVTPINCMISRRKVVRHAPSLCAVTQYDSAT